MLSLTRPLVLASGSPRRKQLLADIGLDFDVQVRPTDEIFPENLTPQLVPAFLAEQKAEQFRHDLGNKIVLCADTVVIVDNEILNKPANADEARQMLRKQSGRQHEVVTAVCLFADNQFFTRSDTAKVYFKSLTDQEIEYYIETCRPFDKAGAYGIQEWIGKIGIERIEGSFYTIMGLPVHLVYEMLQNRFI